MLENIVQAARSVDYRILDELNSTDCEQAHLLKAYLQSIEQISHHW